ncbi:MAG: phosphoglycerate dehydrogenase [Clostridia bacterium]|jgi:D-3-phosphoglycerate dehydrogenase|nr:phosphoglycerate dehydrogenase [Clostridia bacterium]
MKVLVCDPISDKGLEILKSEPGIQVDVHLKKTEEELCALAGDYQGIVVRSETKITKKILEHAKQLKVVGRAGVGIDNIDVEAATLAGVVVVNTPDGNTISAAELTMGMMLAMARHIPQADQSLRQGQWNRSKYVGVELHGKTLGIIGFGKIGSEVGRRSKAFGMNILAYDPYINVESAKRAGVEAASLDTLLKESDIITVHMPLTSETKHMICHEQFAKMKEGVRILNVARGGIIDEDALYEAVKNKKVAGAALDVYEKEPITESPLFGLPEVIVTPHLGASTAEAQVNVAIDVTYEILRVLRGEPVQNAVNIPFIKPELRAVLEPYTVLTERLGKLASCLSAGPIDDISIQYVGEIAEYDLESLTNTFLKGLLRPIMHEAVNYVNAPIVARQRGIAVKEIMNAQSQDYTNQVIITLQGNKKWTRSFTGTVFKNNEMKILRIDQFSLDIQPTGNLVIIQHRDRPKLVGQIGMVLGESDINIAGMQLAREAQGGNALMILTVDNVVDDQVMEKILKVSDIKSATHVAF